MPHLNRKDFIQSLALGGGSLIAFSSSVFAQAPAISAPSITDGRSATLKNDSFKLTLQAGKELICSLIHSPSGTLLADGPYSYSFGTPAFSVAAQDSVSVTLKGMTETGLEVTHVFRVPTTSPFVEEEITIRNCTPALVRSTFRCGFSLPVKAGTLNGFTFTAVPFRREPRDGNHLYADYTLDKIMNQTRWSTLRVDVNTPRQSEDYFSEGWAVTNGTIGFLMTKYNQTAREFAILDTVPSAGGANFRWGGAGSFLNNEEGAIHISPGGEHSFGASRLTAFDGDLTQGYYTFRSEMESRGMGVPNGFNPPVHWNELYDNKLWWLTSDGGQDSVENRKKYYTLEDLKAEATKAKSLGCEALYCDPGWDTNFASKIWDEPRLGKLADFVATLKNDYGLKLSLHTPLSGWCNSSSYPPECFRTNERGDRGGSLCGGSGQYVDETVSRLNTLAEAGVVYFMFDGTMYSGSCWDPAHGHPVPMTCAAHVDATNLIPRKVHEKYPHVSIEMHDQVMGGAPFRYVPLYYGYGSSPDPMGRSTAAGFDTIWGFEMMWDPMGNLRSGQSILLYYYNLAYSLPLYLHIDLRTDNAQALVFWWNASTCRYLGMGGTHGDPKVNEAHVVAMKNYMRLKPYFVSGIFYGIDEETHVHRHPTDNAAVINCFDIDGSGAHEIHFEPAKYGLKTDKDYRFIGATFVKSGDVYVGKPVIVGPGHTLVEVSEA